ncbi:unnamed protein product [Brassica oleracea]
MVTGLSSCVFIRHRSHRRCNLQPLNQVSPHLQSSCTKERYNRRRLSFRRAN